MRPSPPTVSTSIIGAVRPGGRQHRALVERANLRWPLEPLPAGGEQRRTGREQRRQAVEIAFVDAGDVGVGGTAREAAHAVSFPPRAQPVNWRAAGGAQPASPAGRGDVQHAP